MMDWTDRHCRNLLRLFSPGAVLYTEMVAAAALRHGDDARLLAFDAAEHPVALQLGGSDPAELAAAAALGEAYGYDEINLNVGCPSDRVRSGRFGACLMAEPELVADCIAAMRGAVSVPVTVKCRLGIDDLDSDAHLHHFVDRVAAAGCSLFVIHARKAILGGLSPKENREIPPLEYHRVHALARRRPDLEIVVNGGLTGVDQARAQLDAVDGVMIGRQAYQDPAVLGRLDQALLDPQRPLPETAEVVARFRHYLQGRLDEGVPLKAMTRHMLGLFQGLPGARAYRRLLSERARDADAGLEVVDAAVARVCPFARAAA